jgi:predicted RNase H-like HicB family nuclease
MIRHFTLEYWRDKSWFVGRLKEASGVFSQGATLSELEENIRDAYKLMMEDVHDLPITKIHTQEIKVEV